MKFEETPSESNLSAIERLVGEGKKFKDPEALALGKEEADLFITQVTRENEELREKLKESLTLKDFMAELRQTNNRNPDDGNQSIDDNDLTKGKAMTDEDFRSKVQALLDEKETKRIQASNEDFVKQELIKVYGNSYADHVRAKARDLGVSVEFLGELAAKSPKVFLETVAKTASSPVSIPSSVVRTELPKGTKTYEHYRKMMRENPALYSDVRFQQEVFDQAKKVGPAFYQP